MRRILFSIALLVGFGGPALADFADGQRRFSTGDHAGAYAAWLPLAEAGDAKAQYSLGVMHQQGLGRAKDAETASAWFERAARQGYAPAAAALEATGKPPAAQPLTEPDRVEHALRAMLAQPGGGADAAFRTIETASGVEFEIEQATTTTAFGSVFHIPAVGGRASRVAQDALSFEFDIPKVFEGRDSEGRLRRFSATSARTALVWNETLEAATRIDIDWRELALTTVGVAGHVRMDRLVMGSDFRLDGGERWSGPTEVRVEGMEVAAPDETSLKVGAFVLRAELGRADLARLMRMSRGEDANPVGSLGALRTLLSEASLELGIETVDFHHPQGRASLAEGRWRLALSKLDQPAFDLEIDYGHSGFVNDHAALVDDLTPRDAELKLTLARAPMEALLQTGIAAGLEYMLLGRLDSAPAIIETLRKALPAAGTELRIENGLLRAAKAEVTATGAFAADAAAPFGVIGALGVSILGMDEILKSAARPDSAPAHKALAALARRGERAPDGKALLYRFELGRDGRALVNGRTLAELFAE